MQQRDEALFRIRHSSAHLLASAVVERFASDGPVLLGGGPPTQDGFYYDFGLPRSINDDDLVWLQARLRELIVSNIAFEGRVIAANEARSLFSNQPYKMEILSSLLAGSGDAEGSATDDGHRGDEKSEPVRLTVYRHGEFEDLCQGPHVVTSGDIDADGVQILSVAGAYWRGDANRPMLTRIYGTAWRSAKELSAHLERLAEAEKRDHRKLGRDLDLFFFHPTAPGMPYWLPKGLTVLNELLAYWRTEHVSRGYQEIASPLLNHKCLWETSGHWEHYKSDMFVLEMPGGEVFGLKPMNCPNAMLVFNHGQRSYRDLPLRLSDCDILHRHESSGSLHGLLRAQKFQQDDAHIFVSEDLIEAEFDSILSLVRDFYKLFDLKYEFRLSARPEGFVGDVATWDWAEEALRSILDRNFGAGGYHVAPGEGAFYGPKIDILVHDAMQRIWQLGTIQLDLQLPRRFGCAYVDRDGSKKTPVVIHRVIYGSLERFIGVLLEHTGGALPVWLSPVQVRVLPVDVRHSQYASELAERLRQAGVRVEMPADNTLNARIRQAALDKIPYVLVVGDREIAAANVALRVRGEKSVDTFSIDQFLDRWRQVVLLRSMTL